MAALTHHRDDLLLRSLGGQSKSSAAPPAAEGSYCLYSSSHAQSAAGTRVLAAGTSLDKFVTLLSNQEIILKAGPTDDNLVGQVDSSDLWAKWMAYLDPAGILSLTFDSAGAGGQVASFSYSFTNPWDVTFSSDANTLLFVFGSQTGTGAARIPVPGLMPDGSLLYLGLEPGRTATNVTSTVKELAAFSGIETVLPNAVTGWGLTLNPKSAGGKRNALWFDPSSMETTVRLQFGVDGGADLFGTLLAEALPGLSVYSVDAVAKKTFVLADTEAGAGAVVNGSFSFQAECSVAAKTGPGQVDMMACVECFKNAYSIDLLLTTRNSLAGLLAWLSELIAGGSLDSINEILAKDDVFGGVEARQLQIALDTDDESGKLVLSSFKIDLEVSASFGKSNTGSSSVVFLISYAWSKEIGGDGILRGDFWNWFDTSPTRDLGPAYERVEDLYPLAENPALTISLVNIVPGLTVQNMPANIPTDITTAFISLSQDGCLLGGTIESQMWESSSGGYPVPQLDLGVLSLDASYSWGTSENLQLSLGVLAEMKPSTASKHQQSAYLIGSLDYSSGDSSWKLQASLDGLYATTLYEFFDEASADHVMPLLDSVELANANLLYEYAGKAAAGKSAGSHFKMDGQLLIAALQLNLAFEYKDKGWTFTATLAAQNGQATMGDILNSFLGDDDLDLPDFLANMPFSYADGHALDLVVKKCSGNVTASGSKDGSSTAEGGNAASGSPDKDDEAASDSKDDALAAESDQGGNGSSSSSGGGGDTFQLVAQISLGPLQLTFAQIHGSSWPATEPSKRLVQVALTKLPSFDVALIGRLEQPFDEMYYMWIQDATTQIQGQQAAGLSRGDIAALNPSFSAHQLVPKDTFKNPTAGDLLMAAGSHLAVIMKNSSGERSCVLDYCFQKKVAAAVATETPGQATKPLAGKAKEPQGSDAAGDSRDPDESQEPTASSDSSGQDSDGTSSEAPLKKKIGPLSISNIGLKYADKTLHVKLDAELALGPLAFSLMGFSIDVELTSLDPSKMGMPSFSLSGLSVIFNKTPLTIAGIVVHSDDDGLNYYAGGLIVGYIPYQLEAAGFYGEATPEGAAAGAGKTFTSVFVFARLDGPLVTLEFAEISGVTGGFGYKSRVRVPAPDQISDFPFIATQQLDGASDSALQALERLTSPKGDGWFSPVDDSYWAAAGMKIDAFKMLSVDAVIVLQFGASVKLGLFGVAVLDVPNAKSPIKYAHVELGIAVTVDPDTGLLLAEAQLSPNSYIIHPSCHLTGGFAMCYWFDGPHANKDLVGDFVFTLGGYHQAFAVPAGWPNPPRLGISWTLGSHLSVTGEAFFAITPKVCMAGGRLHASFSAGPISAWFDAFANFLINYKPFHFTASAGICVGASFEIDFLFIHIRISVELSADLYLWGPPFGGQVEVDLKVATIHINFGDAIGDEPPASLLEFYQLVLQASSQQQKQQQQQAQAAAPAPGAAVESGQPTSTQAGTQPPGEGHVFLAQSGLMNSSNNPERAQEQDWTVRGGTFSFVIGCKMAIASATLLDEDGKTLTSVTYGDERIYAKPMHLETPLQSTLAVKILQDGVTEDESQWGMDKVLKAVPTGLWAIYDVNADPSSGGGGHNNIDSLLSPSSSSVTLMMGTVLTAPPPVMSQDRLPVFDIADATLVEIDGDPLPAGQPSQETWTPDAPAEGTGQWAAVHDKWKSPSWDAAGQGGDGVQSQFVKTWAQTLGWDAALAALAGLPKLLDGRFNEIYVAAPLMTG